MISEPSRRISSCKSPTALCSLSSERKEFEQTSSARAAVLWAAVVHSGRISCSTTGTPRAAICQAASDPASPPPMTCTARRRSSLMGRDYLVPFLGLQIGLAERASVPVETASLRFQGRKGESARGAGAFVEGLRISAVSAVPRDPRDVRSGDADIGQFAVAELVELFQARVVAPPGAEEVDDCGQHGCYLSPDPLLGMVRIAPMSLRRRKCIVSIAGGPTAASKPVVTSSFSPRFFRARWIEPAGHHRRGHSRRRIMSFCKHSETTLALQRPTRVDENVGLLNRFRHFPSSLGGRGNPHFQRLGFGLASSRDEFSENLQLIHDGRPSREQIPERFPTKVRDPADNNDPHKIGRREPRAEHLGWLHCRQINEFVDHCAWMASQADSRVAYPGRDSSVFSKLLHAK